jgi:small subunit ribosomal protein S9
MANQEIEQFIGLGRRKTAVARVYLRPGRGKIVINQLPFGRYFNERPEVESIIKAPLRETQNLTKYDVIVNVQGGGHLGQAGAIRHGLSRALIKANPAHRGPLKSMGFLTRDSRMKERKKPGQPGARKRFQFSKR